MQVIDAPGPHLSNYSHESINWALNRLEKDDGAVEEMDGSDALCSSLFGDNCSA